MSRYLDRNHWFNILISCSGEGKGETISGSTGRIRSRANSQLEYTTADVRKAYEAQKEYHEDLDDGEFEEDGPISLGTQQLGGFHQDFVHLENPNSTQVESAFKEASKYMQARSNSDYFHGGQVNVYFAGHGSKKDGSLVIQGSSISPTDLFELLSSCVVDRWIRTDIVLDACHSGRFLANFLGKTLNFESAVTPGVIFASCTLCELSYEKDSLRHGIFSLSYLLDDVLHRKGHEFYPKPKMPQGQLEALQYLRLRNGGVQHLSYFKQNPIMYDADYRPQEIEFMGSALFEFGHDYNIFCDDETSSRQIEDTIEINREEFVSRALIDRQSFERMYVDMKKVVKKISTSQNKLFKKLRTHI